MTIKASASVTISIYRDTEAVTRYYKLVSSTASAPSKPTTNPPSGWDDTEPSYTSGSTNTLYFCDLTEFSDGTWAYSAVSKSSSYEAAKEAYNKAQNAQDTAKMAIKNVDVEYYLSTSSTSLSGGSWQTTAPTWVDGKYMWSRTKITDGAGNVTYSPSQNGTCIAGAKGSTGETGAAGTGISSITEEYYLSTSKTSQTGGEWSTTPPTWSSGKYIWTRSKIVYTNPSSTVYTTPVCDSSWEAVNEIEVGGRNLLKKYIRAGGGCSKIDDSTIKVGTTVGDTYFYLRSHCALTAGETYTISCEASNVPDGCNWSFGVRNEHGTWQLYINKNGKNFATGVLDTDIGADSDFILDDMYGKPSTAPNIILTNFKLEKGNKVTDWTPAPEDMVDKANIVSCINQTPESITIQANKISLEGLITANSNFKILSDGSMETIAGKIGGWSIGNNKIYSENQYNTDIIYGDSDYSYHEYTEGTKSVSLVSDNSNNGEVISVLYDFLTWTSDDTENKTPSTQYVKIFDDGRLKIGTEGIWADDTPSIDTTEISGSYITLTENNQENFTCLITPQDIQFVSSIGDSVSVKSSIHEEIWTSGRKSPFSNVVSGSSMYLNLCKKGKLVTGNIYCIMAVGAANYYYTLNEFSIPQNMRPNQNMYINTINHASHSLTYGTTIFVITPEGNVGIQTSNASWLERHACFSYWLG